MTFLGAQYAEKLFVRKSKNAEVVGQQIWEGVMGNDKKAVYRHIVNSEADVNGVYSDLGTTLLHLACETSDIGMLELLLQYGAYINSSDSTGQTPLHRCLAKRKTAFTKLLLARSHIFLSLIFEFMSLLWVLREFVPGVPIRG